LLGSDARAVRRTSLQRLGALARVSGAAKAPADIPEMALDFRRGGRSLCGVSVLRMRASLGTCPGIHRREIPGVRISTAGNVDLRGALGCLEQSSARRTCSCCRKLTHRACTFGPVRTGCGALSGGFAAHRANAANNDAVAGACKSRKMEKGQHLCRLQPRREKHHANAPGNQSVKASRGYHTVVTQCPGFNSTGKIATIRTAKGHREGRTSARKAPHRPA